MTFKILATLLLCFISISAYNQQNELEEFLSNLPNTTFEQVGTNERFESTYEIKIRQPLDHSDLNKGFFNQKVILSHRGFDNLSVMATEGYKAFRKRVYEPTKLLNANQITVEHRFYGNSIPDSLNYSYLNMKQATADLHRIRQLFSDIYKNKWVSTGGSKGGVTSIFYRYFYPKDVDVTIPYVAPIKKSFEEERVYHFLDTVGSDACRESISSFQSYLLHNREKILPILNELASKNKETFSIISINEAFEYAVMEFSFAFWQWGKACDEIPSETSNVVDAVDYFVSISSPLWFGDNSIRKSQSHYYQPEFDLKHGKLI